MSINLGPDILNTSYLMSLNCSQYFIINGNTGYAVWLNDSYHTPLLSVNKLCQAFTNKAKMYLAYCLYEV